MPDTRKNSPSIHVACRNGDLEMVKRLVAEDPSLVDANELLVKYGALDAHVGPVEDITRQYLEAIFLADVARVEALLNNKP